MICERCGSRKAVGKVITVSPMENRSYTFHVCLKCIQKIEAFIRGEASFVPRKRNAYSLDNFL